MRGHAHHHGALSSAAFAFRPKHCQHRKVSCGSQGSSLEFPLHRLDHSTGFDISLFNRAAVCAILNNFSSASSLVLPCISIGRHFPYSPHTVDACPLRHATLQSQGLSQLFHISSHPECGHVDGEPFAVVRSTSNNIVGKREKEQHAPHQPQSATCAACGLCLCRAGPQLHTWCASETLSPAHHIAHCRALSNTAASIRKTRPDAILALSHPTT